MFAQLGNIIFEGIFGFDTFDKTGAVNYAQHELINGKPVLKPTGQNLEEISLTVRLRAEFINVTQAILSLSKSRDEYEILPLIKGTGQYLGDYVITDLSVSETQAMADGTTIDATVQISLLEYVTSDKLQQQQVSARKNAFAIGDKNPFALNVVQSPTFPQLAAEDISAVNSQAAVIDREVSQYENNVSARDNISDHIQKGLEKMDKSLEDFNNKMDEITILDDVQSILSAVAVVRQAIDNFIFPITSISDLQRNNRDLQNVVRSLGSSTAQLINLVITRRA